MKLLQKYKNKNSFLYSKTHNNSVWMTTLKKRINNGNKNSQIEIMCLYVTCNYYTRNSSP